MTSEHNKAIYDLDTTEERFSTSLRNNIIHITCQMKPFINMFTGVDQNIGN